MRFPAAFRTRTAAFAHDLCMIPVAWMAAWWLRLNLLAFPEELLSIALISLPILVGLQVPVFHYFGLYRGVWRFASLPDLARIIKSVIVGALLATSVLFIISRLEGIPRSVIPLYAILLIMGLGGSRFFYRWCKDRGPMGGHEKRVLIVGAGRTGEMLVRDLSRGRKRQYLPVAFVDDADKRKAADIHGIRVVGSCKDIPEIVQDWAIDLVLMAMPSSTAEEMRRVVEICETAGVEFRTVPRRLHDLQKASAISGSLREVSIEDLLARDPVALNWRAIKVGIAGKTVLVSGGGGSIGAELCRQIVRLNPSSLVIFERSEFALYQIENELRAAVPDISLYPMLGDVVDTASVEDVFRTYRPNVVFHAAAYKHVPILERQIREAVRNNVIGTRVMAEAAHRFGMDAFVLISTDKAVNPANILGATKRAAELVCQAYSGISSSRFITVRFGNVLGSAGSVVPLFQAQIQNDGPVTITHPQVTRYFMTIPEACQLILQSGVLGNGGEIFILDMGKPVKIADLAEQMIRLAGKIPGRDIDIVYTGLRPGEKLQEELVYRQETLVATPHDKILLAMHHVSDKKNINAVLNEMAKACDQCNDSLLEALLRRLVPSYRGLGNQYIAAENVISFKDTVDLRKGSKKESSRKH